MSSRHAPALLHKQVAATNVPIDRKISLVVVVVVDKDDDNDFGTNEDTHPQTSSVPTFGVVITSLIT